MNLQARLTRLEEQANAVTVVVAVKKEMPFDAAAYITLLMKIIKPGWLPGAVERMKEERLKWES